jgi:beta-lactam-binding protein with PASTA domain
VDATDSLLIYKGSFIDLIVGRGLSHQSTFIPDVVGMSVEKAKDKINDAVLNLGAIIEDHTDLPDQDTIEAFIYKQRPAKDMDRRIPLGSAIDVWITTDSTKLPFYMPPIDSTEIELVKEEI